MKTCKNDECCQDMAHTADVKACKKCKTAIRGWNCQLCDTCSTGLNQCGHCGQPFDQ